MDQIRTKRGRHARDEKRAHRLLLLLELLARGLEVGGLRVDARLEHCAVVDLLFDLSFDRVDRILQRRAFSHYIENLRGIEKY